MNTADTTSLRIAQEALSEFEPGSFIGLEKRYDMNQMAVGFGTFLKSLNGGEQAAIAPLVEGRPFKLAMRSLEETPISSLDNYRVPVPEGLNSQMVPYLRALKDAMNDLEDVKKRTLEPLRQWAGKAISEPDHVEKAWLDKHIKTVDIDVHILELSKLYSDQIGDNADGILHKVYPTVKSIRTAKDLLDELVEKSNIVLGYQLNEIADEIASLVKRVVDENDRADLLKKAPQATIARLSELLYQSARELELLASLMFQVKAAAHSFNESMTKISKDI